MKILHRYILRELFQWFFLLCGIFLIILLVKEFYDSRDEIADEEPEMVDVAQYVAFVIPHQFVEALPLLTMFSTLFALGLLAKNREIMAMVAAGNSFNYLAIPVFMFGLAVTAGTFILADYIAPEAQRRADFIYEVRIKGENQFSYTANDEIFRKGEGNRYYIMSSYDSRDKVMHRPSILDLNEHGDSLVRRIEAERAAYNEEKKVWEFEGAQIWTFGDSGLVSHIERYKVPVELEMEDKLSSFLAKEKKPEEMTISELDEYASILERQGENPRLSFFRTSVQAKFALPFSCLLLSLVGYAIAADLKTRRFVLAFSAGLAFGVAYYVIRESAVGLGHSGMIPSTPAAWTPVAVFALIVLGMMRRINQVH